MYHTHVIQAKSPDFELWGKLQEESARIYRWVNLLNDWYETTTQSKLRSKDGEMIKAITQANNSGIFSIANPIPSPIKEVDEIAKSTKETEADTEDAETWFHQSQLEPSPQPFWALLEHLATEAHYRCDPSKAWKLKPLEEVIAWTCQPLRYLAKRSMEAVVKEFYSADEGTSTKRRKGDKRAKYQRPDAFFRRFRPVTWDSQGATISVDPKIEVKSNRRENIAKGWVSCALKQDASADLQRPSFQLPRHIAGVLEGAPPNIVRLVYHREKNLYEWHIGYEDGKVPQEQKGKQIAAIDLGEIHPAAMVTTNGDGVVFSCRELRSAHQWRNKSLAVLSEKLSRCERGSRKWRKLRRAKNRTLRHSENKIKDINHKLTSKIAKVCQSRGVKTVHIGDVRGVADGKRLNRKSQQKISNWSHGEHRSLLTQKLGAYGISVELTSERYTTQTCPNCEERHKPKGRVYSCPSCGFEAHRDIVGATNILSRALHDEIGRLTPPTEVRFLQPYKVGTRKPKVSRSSSGSVPFALGVDQEPMAGTSEAEAEVSSNDTKPLEPTGASCLSVVQTFALEQTADQSRDFKPHPQSTVYRQGKKSEVRANLLQLSLFPIG